MFYTKKNEGGGFCPPFRISETRYVNSSGQELSNLGFFPVRRILPESIDHKTQIAIYVPAYVDELTGEAVFEVRLRDKTPEELEADFQSAFDLRKNDIVNILNKEAQLKGYFNIDSACSYAGAPNVFQRESMAFVMWRAAIWSAWFALERKIASKEVAVTGTDDLVSLLPKLEAYLS